MVVDIVYLVQKHQATLCMLRMQGIEVQGGGDSVLVQEGQPTL